MADNEMMEVQSTVAEITNDIEGQKNLALPMIKGADADGTEIWGQRQQHPHDQGRMTARPLPR